MMTCLIYMCLSIKRRMLLLHVLNDGRSLYAVYRKLRITRQTRRKRNVIPVTPRRDGFVSSVFDPFYTSVLRRDYTPSRLGDYTPPLILRQSTRLSSPSVIYTINLRHFDLISDDSTP
jgi:hypothetical protein